MLKKQTMKLSTYSSYRLRIKQTEFFQELKTEIIFPHRNWDKRVRKWNKKGLHSYLYYVRRDDKAKRVISVHKNLEKRT